MEELYELQTREVYETKLLYIYSGQLLPYVEEALALEIKDRAALDIAKQRIAPINLCTRITNKLAKTYVDGCDRDVDANTKDADLLNYYEDSLKIDTVLARADKLLELHKYCALEPFFYNGKPAIRVLPADTFKVLSDDPYDTCYPTIFIKYLGTYNDKNETVDKFGAMTTTTIRVSEYEIWTDKEYLIIDLQDNNGVKSVNVKEDKLLEYGIVKDVEGLFLNPYGRIPFVYVKKEDFNLIPYPDTDTLQMTLLIPKLLTDLNYAAQFKAHSIFYGIDCEINNISGNHDSFMQINSKEGSTAPQVGTITPSVDIAGVSQQIELQVGLWLQSRGIRAGATGKPYDSQSISGVAKMIDEMDTTQHRKESIQLWTQIEYQLWELISYMHNMAWSQLEWQYPEWRYEFSTDFCKNFSINFNQPDPGLSEADEIANIKALMDMGLISKKTALGRLNPTLSEEQVEEVLSDIEMEKTNGSTEQPIQGVTENSEVVSPADQVED